jgi:hypothetical protein
MEVAALLAVGLGDWVDFGVIVGILMLNAFVGCKIYSTQNFSRITLITLQSSKRNKLQISWRV